ncbi:MAG: hypothetical protein HY505_01145 [Candidatus Yanofskybacteria bacterium]|nr:hypothetical protein [Candidatus Yanofskybacteria bacterium]
MEKRCVVGYKRAAVEGSGHTYGEVFDKLDACCHEFRRWFEDTGNYKTTSFNHPENPSQRLDNGFCFETRGSMLTLVLRAHTEPNPKFCEIVPADKINFCPFCGAEVEVKCTKSVTLKPRTKEVFDGYDEEVIWEKGGENPQGRFKEVLNEASERVAAWPEWKKSDALRSSEQRR